MSVYKCRGSHRTEREIKSILGKDPGIHSGFAGKGAFCLTLTQSEYGKLKAAGIKLSSKPIR
jgi:hypothetical protein